MSTPQSGIFALGTASHAYLEFDLAREIEQLQREPKWTAGKNARTLLKYDAFRVVLMGVARSRTGADASN